MSRRDECVRCRSSEQTFYELSCKHSYCLICCAYRFLKLLSQGSPSHNFLCEVCEQSTEMEESTIELLNKIIREEIVPKISKHISPDTSAAKSDMLQFTPSVSRQLSANQVRIRKVCSQHPKQQVEFSCHSCRNSSLCWKCVSENHRGHSILSTQFGNELFREKAQLSRFQVKLKIDELILRIQRSNELSGILSQREQSAAIKIEKQFSELLVRVEDKKKELRLALKEAMASLDAQLKGHVLQCQKQIEALRGLDCKIAGLMEGDTTLQEKMAALKAASKESSGQPRIQFPETQFLSRSENLFDSRDLIPSYQNLNLIRLHFQEQEGKPQLDDDFELDRAYSHKNSYRQYSLYQKKLDLHSQMGSSKKLWVRDEAEVQSLAARLRGGDASHGLLGLRLERINSGSRVVIHREQFRIKY